MTDLQTSPDHRLIRVFLARDEPTTFEVYACFTPEDPDYVCTCPGFSVRAKCKHIDHVRSDDRPSGHAAVLLQADTPFDQDEINELLADPIAFRAWVLRWGRVAVL